MTRIAVTDRAGRCLHFDAVPGQRVLHAGLAAALPLPYECATGTCGSCRATVESGAPQRLWPDAPGARNFRSQTDVLMCQIAAEEALALSLRTAFGEPLPISPRYHSGVLRRTADLSPDVSTFAVELDEPMAFQAGQFALLALPGVEGPRAYSMTAHASPSRTLSFLIRRCPGGVLSDRLFRGSEAASGVEVFGPLGKAVFDPAEGRPFIAIAGGSGIAGILAILDHAAQAGHFAEHPCHVFFGLRDPAGAYCLDELAAFVEQSGGALRVTVGFSDAGIPANVTSRWPALTFSHGLIPAIAEAALPQDATPAPLYYVAGPPPMVDAAMRLLVVKRKISPKDIRYDKFG